MCGGSSLIPSSPSWYLTKYRYQEKGQLEHCIPASFSLHCPPNASDQVDLSDTAFRDHSSASHIPRPPRDGRPAIVGDPIRFRSPEKVR
ncbi:hypothetical protein GGR53DRAFT_499402 [Hypoxylon sp. FL1150]|nr:hypothetical protein GGR53DRAFT_499402 [Hypoxylon sp. FL1150]